MPINKEELNNVMEELTEALQEGLQGLVTGAQSDVRAYAAQITRDSVAAFALAPDERQRVLNEIKGQLGAIGELNRIRAVNAGWGFVERAVGLMHRVIAALIPVPV